MDKKITTVIHQSISFCTVEGVQYLTTSEVRHNKVPENWIDIKLLQELKNGDAFTIGYEGIRKLNLFEVLEEVKKKSQSTEKERIIKFRAMACKRDEDLLFNDFLDTVPAIHLGNEAIGILESVSKGLSVEKALEYRLQNLKMLQPN